MSKLKLVATQKKLLAVIENYQGLWLPSGHKVAHQLVTLGAARITKEKGVDEFFLVTDKGSAALTPYYRKFAADLRSGRR